MLCVSERSICKTQVEVAVNALGFLFTFKNLRRLTRKWKMESTSPGTTKYEVHLSLLTISILISSGVSNYSLTSNCNSSIKKAINKNILMSVAKKLKHK